MKKNYHYFISVMRISFLSVMVLSIFSLVSFSKEVSGQLLKARINAINFRSQQLSLTLRELEQKHDVKFAYDEKELHLEAKIAPEVKLYNTTLDEILKKLFRPAQISYREYAGMIYLEKMALIALPGRITGKVVDEKGEGLPGASIRILETGKMIRSNIDGSYQFTLPAGTYTLEFTYLSYQKQRVSSVKVVENGTTPLDINMKPGSKSLSGVTISTDYKKASVTGLYARQKNNAAMTNGISAEQMARTPDKNIGEVLKRVSGVAVIDNKYVTVRGLGERYNGAMLNGQLLPSTELNRKQFTFDVIPSNMVDNVTVVKTLTPDMSAEFGGGIVQVNTKEIPDENFTILTVGSSFNDHTTGKEFRTIKIEGREYLGFAARSKYLLGSLDWKNKDEIFNSGKFIIVGDQPLTVKDQFDQPNNWAIHNYKAGLSPNFQFSAGRVLPLQHEQKIGLIGTVSYRNTWQTQDMKMSRNGFYPSQDLKELYGFKGKQYGFTTNVAALAGGGYTDQKNQVQFQSLYLRSLDHQFILGTGKHMETNTFNGGYYDLNRQTTLWQNQIKGSRAFGSNGLKVNWMGSYTYMDRQSPDNHIMEFVAIPEGPGSVEETHDFSIKNGAYRNWSRALEHNLSWNLDLTVPFRFSVLNLPVSNAFKMGYAGWQKHRQFWYVLLATGPKGSSATGYKPVSQIFDPKFNSLDMTGVSFTDDFDSKADLHAVYGMFDQKIGEHLRLVWGLRAEYFNLNKSNPLIESFIKRQGENGDKTDYSSMLKREPNWNLFPSASLIYSLNDRMNLRLAYSRSIIRPDLREMSYFKQYDFELGGEYSSESPVLSTKIKNYDLRYEWYPAAGDVVSFSLFYKKLIHPMEIYKNGDLRVYSLRNNAWAINKGYEFEFRKSFAFTAIPVLKNITVYGNFTRLYSSVTPMKVSYVYPPLPGGYFKQEVVEQEFEKENRPQAGASNYVGNAGLYYDEKRFSLSMSYNYVSNRAYRVSEIYPDGLFERPLNALDGQVTVKILRQKGELKLNIGNILNSTSIIYQNSYPYIQKTQGIYERNPTTKELLYDKGQDILDYEAAPGRTYSLTFSYKF